MQLTPAERLIVAADFKPRSEMGQGRADVASQILTLAQSLKGTGVYIKVNSGLRASGYGLINQIHSLGLRVFADLKLFDIGETLATDGVLLREAKPEIVTTVCAAGISALRALRAELPDTEILGVTVLTSLTEADAITLYGANIQTSIMMFARVAEAAGMDGLICAPTDLGLIRSVVKRSMSYNTPGIRPKWAKVSGDDQNPDRVMTPAKAIAAGADRIVVGRPIVKAESPYDAVMRTLDEIFSAMT